MADVNIQRGTPKDPNRTPRDQDPQWLDTRIARLKEKKALFEARAEATNTELQKRKEQRQQLG